MEFLPDRDSELVTYTNQFSALLTSSPTTFGVSLGQAADFASVNSAWVAAYNASVAQETRGPAATFAKKNAKRDMLEKLRELAGFIRENPAVTPENKFALGLHEQDPEPSPVPVPDFAPAIEFVSIEGTSMIVRLWDTQNPDNRGKPNGVYGAAVFTAVAAAPPPLGDMSQWQFRGNTSKTKVAIDFPADIAPGSTVWVTAYWFNTRLDSGPSALPVSRNLPGTLLEAA
jgi:hypothetical protein